MVIESAFDRILRNLYLAIGIGSLVFSLLGVPLIIEQWSSLDSRFVVTAIVLFSGIPLVLGAMSFRASIRLLRSLAIAHLVVGAVLLAAWVPSMVTDSLPGDRIPWLINTVSVATCLAALVLPARAAWAYLVAIAAGGGILRYIVYGGGDASLAVQDAIMIVLISGLMMALLQLALRAGREQDAAGLHAQDTAAHTAAASSLETQRARYHAFMHDDVLATLNAAARNVAGAEEVTRGSARAALRKMDGFMRGDVESATRGSGELEMLFRNAARTSKIELHVNAVHTDGVDIDMPVEASDALAEALTEAVRNSIRHADWPDRRIVHRNAHITITGSSVRIIVTDDGKGFQAHRIELDRLGIRVSILQRVNSQPGCRATVRSSRGRGTTVTLEWHADEVTDEN